MKILILALAMGFPFCSIGSGSVDADTTFTERDRHDLKKALKRSGIDHKDFDGNTAMHSACEFGRSSVVAFLLELNPNMSITNDKGETPLQVAASKGHTEIVTLLDSWKKKTVIDAPRSATSIWNILYIIF
jgi:ankyrin repeat protein